MSVRGEAFRREVRRYYRRHRRDLPWRRTRSPYRILVSEIMLQQTQVERVGKKYAAFLRRFPSFRSLARASNRDVLAAWQGLGYNRRALNLKRLAEAVRARHGGRLPADTAALEALPGVGKATAGAVLAFAFNKPAVFIETNIRRAFIHFFLPGRRAVRDEEIAPLVRATLDRKDPREWYYALMDYGAMLGQAASENPNRRSARYRRQPAFKGSNRELRGKILRALLRKGRMTVSGLARETGRPSLETRSLLGVLAREGFLKIEGRSVRLERGMT